MKFAFKIALRYFFSKSQQTVINRINGLALILVVVATSALFVVLSAFDGLKNFGLSFTNSFDPDYLIQPAKGKYFYVDKVTLRKIKELEGIVAAAPEIEEKVFLSFNEKNQVGYLKGVDPSYTSVIPVDELLLFGDWIDFIKPQIVAGFGIANNLSLGVYDYTTFLNISVPRKKKGGLLSQDRFTTKPSYVVGLFQVSEELDQKFIFSAMDFAQNLLELESDQYSGIVLKVLPGTAKETVLPYLEDLFKNPIVMTSRRERNAALHRMLNVENLATYFIFTLVMVIALFNVVGSLIMMILDKQAQMKILSAMGTAPKDIQKIFFFIGLLICGVGGSVGLILGSVIVGIQTYAPFIYVPGTSLPYPVIFNLQNLMIVFLTLMVLSLVSAAWATRGVHKKAKNYTVNS